MPRARVGHSFDSPTIDVMIDMGHPFLNRTVDGFLKIGMVGAAHAGTQEAFGILRKGSNRLSRPFHTLVSRLCLRQASGASLVSWNSTMEESVNKKDLERGIKKMAAEGARWGVVAGVYCGMEYGIQQARGRHDWKNAMLGGALTGALLTFGDRNYDKERMLTSAITGGAIAAATEFLRFLT